VVVNLSRRGACLSSDKAVQLAQLAACGIVCPMTAIHDELVQLHASVCKGLADPKRLMIINALRDRERTVTELVDELAVPQANVSQHLAVLRDKGLVQARKDGQFVHYSVTTSKIVQAMDLMREVMAEQVHAPAAG